MNLRYFLKLVVVITLGVFALNFIGIKVWSKLFAKPAVNDFGIREVLNKEELIRNDDQKVVFLGNSVLFSANIAEDKNVFVNQLQTNVNQNRTGKKFKFINVGLEGSDIWREFDFVSKNFLNANIESVIWFISINDFKLPYDVNAMNTNVKPVNDESAKNLIFFELLNSELQRIRAHGTAARKDEHDKFYTDLLIKEIEPAILQSITIRIKNFNTELKANRIKLVVVFLPSRQFIETRSWEEAKSFVQMKKILDTEEIENHELFGFLKSACGVDCFTDYVHLNQTGHDLLAQGLLQKLRF